jgi:hypothetical protein
VVEEPDLTGATYYKVAERPSLGDGQWIVTADDTAYFQPANGALPHL